MTISMTLRVVVETKLFKLIELILVVKPTGSSELMLNKKYPAL